EGQEPVGDRVEVVEVVGGKDLALDGREVDLDLVEPGGVHGQVHQPCGGPGFGHPVDRCLPTVGRAVVGDEEDTACGGVGLGGHDLFDQTGERHDPAGVLAAAKDAGVVDIQRGEVGQRALALVLVFDTHRSA